MMKRREHPTRARARRAARPPSRLPRLEILETRHLLAAGIWQGDLDVTITTDLQGGIVNFAPGRLKFQLDDVAAGNGKMLEGEKGANARIPWTGDPSKAPPGGTCNLGQIVITKNGTVQNRKVSGSDSSNVAGWGWNGSYEGNFDQNYDQVQGTWTAVVNFPSCDEFDDPVAFPVEGTWISQGDFVGDVAVTDVRFQADRSLRVKFGVTGHKLPVSTDVVAYWATNGAQPNSDKEGKELLEIRRWAVQDIQNFDEVIAAVDLPAPPVGATHVVVVADPTSANAVAQITDPLGKVREADEQNNVQASLVDHRAISLVYVQGQSRADDELQFTYFLDGDLPQNSYANLYWTRGAIDSEATFNGNLINSALRSATSIPLAGTLLTAGQHTLRFKATDISNGVPQVATLIVAHIDSSGGAIGKFAGDVVEIEERNNFVSFQNIRPDVFITDLQWNPLGGVTVEYGINNRIFLDSTVDVLVRPFWGSNVPATVADGKADPDQRSVHLPAANFLPPRLGIDGLTVVMDPDNLVAEQNEPGEQNEKFLLLTGLTPEIRFEFSGVLERKQSYDVLAVVKNVAPVPLNVAVAFQEIAEDAVRNTGSCTDRLDASTCSQRANRSNQSSPVIVGLQWGEERPVSLASLDGGGAFNRTWNWIPTQNELTNLNTSLYQLTQEEDASAIAEKIVDWAKDKAGPVGDLITGFETLLQSLQTIQKVPLLKGTAAVEYQATVTAQAGNGVPTASSKSVNLGIPLANTTALQSYENLTTIKKLLTFSVIQALRDLDDDALKQQLEADLEVIIADVQQATAYYLQALDPPDFNFTQIADPTLPNTLPGREHLVGLYQRELLAWRQIRVLDDAIALTSDRVLGAQIAGEPEWLALQLIARSDLATEIVRRNTHRIAADMLQGAMISQVLAPGFADLQTAVRSGGLPQAIRDRLAASGASPQVIAEIEAIVTQTPDNPLAAPDLYMMVMAAEVAQRAGAAERDLLAAITIRIQDLGTSVVPVTTAQRAQLTTDQEKLAQFLAGGLPTIAFREHVFAYLERVRDLLKSTNNVDALADDLRLGHAALSQFQLLSVKPDDFRLALDRLSLPEALKTAIQAALQESTTLFAAGQFAAAFGKYDAVVDLIARDGSGGEGASQAAAHARYVLDLNRPLDAPSGWQNPRDRFDVNDDGSITPVADVLPMINELNLRQIIDSAQRLPVPPVPPVQPPPFYDVNGDGSLTATGDVLPVVNRIIALLASLEGESQPAGRQPAEMRSAEGEGEGVSLLHTTVGDLVAGGRQPGTGAELPERLPVIGPAALRPTQVAPSGGGAIPGQTANPRSTVAPSNPGQPAGAVPSRVAGREARRNGVVRAPLKTADDSVQTAIEWIFAHYGLRD